MPNTAAARTDDNVERLDVARAKRVLEDMVNNPFFLIVFTPKGAEAVVKGLDDDAAEMIRRVMSSLGD